MRRREFITLIGGAGFWPGLAWAQHQTKPVLGLLASESPDLFADRVRALHEGLQETGYFENRNLSVEYRWAQGQNNRLPDLAADLNARQVAVIVTIGGTPVARAAKAATKTIPILFQVGVDPVDAGLVASLNRPGANLTGVTTLGVELGPKRLEILHELLPNAETIGLLVNSTNPIVAESERRSVEAAARSLGLKLLTMSASTEGEFNLVFAKLSEQRAAGLLVGNDGFLNSHAGQLAALGIRHRLPIVHTYRTFAVAGGLISYGGNFTDPYRRLGVYAGRILNGETPADLPVQQSTKVELVVNLKTARLLGLAIPASLQARADEVIE